MHCRWMAESFFSSGAIGMPALLCTPSHPVASTSKAVVRSGDNSDSRLMSAARSAGRRLTRNGRTSAPNENPISTTWLFGQRRGFLCPVIAQHIDAYDAHAFGGQHIREAAVQIAPAAVARIEDRERVALRIRRRHLRQRQVADPVAGALRVERPPWWLGGGVQPGARHH